MPQSLSSLPVGALVKDTGTTYNNNPIVWRVLEHGHSGDPSGSTALEARDIISVKAFDAKEPSNSNSNRQSYGNNRYLHSNLLQWLNSDAAANSWYTAQHAADQAPTTKDTHVSYNPYTAEKGFLQNFSTELQNALMTVNKVTAKNTVTDGGGYETVSSKVFLLSTTEVGLANENNVAEGSIYAYYSADNQDSRRVKKPTAECVSNSEYQTSSFNTGAGWTWWLRTPTSGLSYYVRYVSADGSLGYGSAYNGLVGLAPAFCIPSTTEVSTTTDSDGCYIMWPEPNTRHVTVDGLIDILGDLQTKADARFSGGGGGADVPLSVDNQGRLCITYEVEDE